MLHTTPLYYIIAVTALMSMILFIFLIMHPQVNMKGCYHLILFVLAVLTISLVNASLIMSTMRRGSDLVSLDTFVTILPGCVGYFELWNYLCDNNKTAKVANAKVINLAVKVLVMMFTCPWDPSSAGTADDDVELTAIIII